MKWNELDENKMIWRQTVLEYCSRWWVQDCMFRNCEVQWVFVVMVIIIIIIIIKLMLLLVDATHQSQQCRCWCRSSTGESLERKQCHVIHIQRPHNRSTRAPTRAGWQCWQDRTRGSRKHRYPATQVVICLRSSSSSVPTTSRGRSLITRVESIAVGGRRVTAA